MPSDPILSRNQALRELLALARRQIEDGVITLAEADELRGWLESNPDMSGVWPVPVLSEHVRRYLADGRLSSRDREGLLALLMDLVGEGRSRPEDWGKLDRSAPRDGA